VAGVAMFGCAPVQKSPPPAVATAGETVSPTPRKPAPPTAYEIPPEQKRDMYMGCWSFFNSRKLEKILDCYHENASFEMVGSHCPVSQGPATYLERISAFLLAVPDAKAKLELTLTHENTVVGVALIRGTHTGPLETPHGEIAATNKPVGFLFGHAVEFDKNRIAKDRWFRDPNTMLSQIGKSSIKGRKAVTEAASEKPAPVAQDSDQEKTNVGLFNNYFAALNTHDLERVEPMLSDDYVHANQFAAKDYSGKGDGLKYHEALLGAFSDLRIEHQNVFGAGDFVVGFSTFDGTHDGPLRAWNAWKGSGRKVSLGGLDILEVVAGKVRRHLTFADGQALAQQLGLVDVAPEGAGCNKKAEAAAEPPAPSVDVDVDVDADTDAAGAPPANATEGAEPKK
jgi:predicted ester cyclase